MMQATSTSLEDIALLLSHSPDVLDFLHGSFYKIEFRVILVDEFSLLAVFSYGVTDLESKDIVCPKRPHPRFHNSLDVTSSISDLSSENCSVCVSIFL